MLGIATAKRPGDVQMLEAHETPQYCDDAQRRHKRGDGRTPTAPAAAITPIVSHCMGGA
jgi:hypothetical protein